MKKIYGIILASMLIFSCDMDKSPYGDLDVDKAIGELNDAMRYRDGVYSGMRGRTTGSSVYLTDIQMDIFQGVVGNGNRNGLINNGNVLSSDNDILGLWAAFWGTINSANYLIEKTEAMIASESYEGDNLAKLKRYNGEALFVRAFCYYWMMDHYCDTYSADNAQAEAKGLPIVTVYHPTSDRSKYPGRSTLEETYKLIEDDLAGAYSSLKEYEAIDNAAVAPNVFYFSSYAVMALQARVALLKGDNTTALAKAEGVINSGVYSLAELNDYAKMWSEDTSSEIIFRSFMSNTEMGSSIGAAYLSQDEKFADYLPTYDVLNMYHNDDVRFDAFFDVWTLVIDGRDVKAFAFTKYPGNESLKTGAQPNYMHMSKPFRLSEMYLIAAEAAAANAPDKANKYLNDLRAKRIEGYTGGTYSGQTLVQEIREERHRELLGEGHRMSDLRRWGLGFSRRPDHPENVEIEGILLVTGKSLSYPAKDHRFVWPIPSSEMSANPQLQGQQNPGY